METEHSSNFRKKRRNRRIFYIFVGLFLVGYTLFWKTYNDINLTSNNIFNNLNTKNMRESEVTIEATQPISFAFLGVDNGAQGRTTDSGRSDAIIIGTVNPKTRTTTLVSLPRDTYALMADYELYEDVPYYDKLTHAYAFGEAEMAINSIQELINIPIDYYVEVNMQGFIDIIDSLGGITVTSPLSFEERGFIFEEDKEYVMDGEQALVFARMRMFDPEGDFGRQKREKMVIKAMLDKVLSLGTLTNYNSILETLEDNVKTNLTFKDMTTMARTYGKALENFETKNLIGEELWLDDIYYLYTYPEDRLEVSNKLRDQLEITNIELEDLNLSDVDYNYYYEPSYEYYEEDYSADEYVEDYSEY